MLVLITQAKNEKNKELKNEVYQERNVKMQNKRENKSSRTFGFGVERLYRL